MKCLLLVGVALSAVAAGLVGAAGAHPGEGSEGDGSDEPARWADEVAARDELVAAQEALLNAYRCRFDIDTDSVLGGCADGAPVLPAAGPEVFEGVADAGDVAERDALVASQEALLNVYRCRFDIDTEAVPGGCWDGVPAIVTAGEPQRAVLAVGSRPSCAIRGDQTVECWNVSPGLGSPGNWGGEFVPQPGGRFAAIAARHESAEHYQFHDSSVCGIRVDESLWCWSHMVPFEGEEVGEDVFPVGGAGSLLEGVPEGRFVDVALGKRHGCAIRVDQSLACWGADYLGKLRFIGPYWEHVPMGVSDAPKGRFRSVSTSSERTCAIGVDLALVCWGPHFDIQPRPGVPESPYHALLRQPEGRFTDVAVGDWHACAIRLDRTLACWGHRGAPVDPPSGEFIAVASSYQYSCAIRADQTIACWTKSDTWMGFEDVGQIDPPEGRFTAIAAGPLRACAQRADGEVVCWGDRQLEPYTAPPPIQAVYEVKFGAEAVPGRVQQIAQWVEQAQAWYRDQTGGRHPLFKRDRNGDISVSVIVEQTQDQRGYSLARQQHGQHVVLARFVEPVLDPRPSRDLICAVAGGGREQHLYFYPHCFEIYGRDFVPLSLAHELAHVFGAAYRCAPNWAGGGHVGDDPRELLYRGPDGYGSSILVLANRVLDVGRDDYFGHGRDDCFDIARNPLLGME